MAAAEEADELHTDLGVAPEVAWEILTCAEGARLWLADQECGRVEVGAEVPVRAVGRASVVAAAPPSAATDTATATPGRLELRLADGSGATLRFDPLKRVVNGNEQTVTRLVLARPGVRAAPEIGWRHLVESAAICVARVGRARKPRQAILVIHGIGNQRPLTTARRFTDVLADRSERWSKPDRLSSSAELRRFQLRRTTRRPRTDVYELYWADKVPGTAIRHITAWLRGQLLRRPAEVSPGMRPVLYLFFAALVVAVAALVAALATVGADRLGGWWESATGLAGISFVVAFVSGALVKTVGDAARYLDDDPDNIAVRQSIREAGVAMLRRLHEEEHYDRVVVVGHSLGSVIAYDVLRQYWAEVCDDHGYPVSPRQRALKDYLADVGGATRERQQALWEENRRLGARWLVTDLVTLGCPLTHATSLLAHSRADLEERRRELSLPTCPPRPDGKTFTQDATYVVDGQLRTVQTLTHGCPFAVTRWTNLYAPVRWGFFGDLVGGPVAPEFGAGVVDVVVQVEPWWRRRTLLAHTAYWLAGTASAKQLVDAVDVDSAPWLDRHTAAMPWRTTLAAAAVDIRRDLAP